jgi:nucleotide-binding universal stress UspA family protein
MKKILLPTDFSENSWNAIKYALQLFKDEKCKFFLLNTYTPIIYHIEYVLVNPAQFGLGDAIRETALRGLESVMEKVDEHFSNPNHEFESIAAFNTLVPEIRELTEQHDLDYVIMGTKGATGAKEILFGSNTVQVFKNIKCPVIAVPNNFDYEVPKEILFPSDYNIAFQNKHLDPMINIAVKFDSRMHVLHTSNDEALSEWEEKNREILEDKFKSITHLFHFIKYQKVPEAISNFQLKVRINLLVMINNKHSFFENLFFKSNINQIGFHLNIPFMVIPSKF